jgi:hypothetical protein
MSQSLNYALCDDCVIWHANGDATGFCDCSNECDSPDCDAIKTAPGLGHDIIDGYGDERYFSRVYCDACERPLGGNRTDCTSHTRGSRR